MSKVTKLSLLNEAAKSKEIKETAISQILILAISVATYVFFSIFHSFVVFASLTLIDMVAFHVLWYYRENKELGVTNPLGKAIMSEFITIILAISTVIGIFFALQLIHTSTGFPPFFGFLLFAFGGIGFLFYKVYEKLDKLAAVQSS